MPVMPDPIRHDPTFDENSTTVDVTYTVYGEYYYFADFAVSLGARANPDPDVSCVCTRIWANGILIYDGPNGVRYPDLEFRFYPGVNTQRQDPTMVKALGADATPAYRDLMYLVFTEFNCSDFDGRVPAITAEIMDGVNLELTVATISELGGTIGDGVTSADLETDTGYILVETSATDVQLRRFRLSDRIETVRTVFQTPYDFARFELAPWAGISICEGPNEPYFFGNSASTTMYVHSLQTGAVTSSFGQGITPTEAYAFKFWTTTGMRAFRVNNGDGWDTFFVGTGSSWATSVGVWTGPRALQMLYHDPKLGLIFAAINDDYQPTLWAPDRGLLHFVVSGEERLGETDVYVPTMAVGASSSIRAAGWNFLSKMTVGEAGSLGADANTFSAPPAYPNKLPKIDGHYQWFTYDNGGAWGSAACYAGKYLPEDDSLITLWTNTVGGGTGVNAYINAKIVKIKCADASIIWESVQFRVYAPQMYTSNFNQQFRSWEFADERLDSLLIPRYADLGQTGYAFIDTATGEITDDTDALWTARTDHPMVYDSHVNSVYDLDNGKVFRFGVPDVSGFSLSITSAVQTLAQRAGYAPLDVLVSGLDDYRIDGYIIDGQRSLGDVLGGLSVIYDFNFFERDDQLIVSRKRDEDGALTVDFTVSGSELGVISEGDMAQQIAPFNLTPDTKLPGSIAITYFDTEVDYQPNTQLVKRTNSPHRTQQSDMHLNLSVPLVLSGSQVSGLMYTMLYNMWAARNTLELRLPPRYIEADPGDTVEFPRYGTTYKGTIQRTRRNADWSVSTVVTITSDSFAVEGETQPPIQPPNDINMGTSVLRAVMELPALYPAERNPSADSLYIRVGLGNYASSSWLGGQLEASDTGATSDLSIRLLADAPAQIGTVTTAPLRDVLSWQTDYDSQIVVSNNSIDTDTLVAATYDELLGDNYRNLIAIGDGIAWELVQWMDFELVDDRTIRFTGLFRGRFGTEYYRSAAKPGSLCVIIDDATVTVAYPRKMLLDDTRYVYRTRAPNTPNFRAELGVLRLSGNFRRPHAPCNVKAVRAPGDGSVTITWERRARFNGELRDGTADVILDEDREYYAVDIYNADRTSVMRSFEQVKQRSVWYGPNMQATDGNDGAADLYVHVYQINETHVGRGFPGGGLINVS